jgi:PIN domain nuclease of toxin-antitoxin system
VNYLLDTVVFLYFLKGQKDKFSRQATKILKDPQNSYLVSSVSLWEISIKYSLEKLPLEKKPGLWLREFIQKLGWIPLPILDEHALRVVELPYHHKDPFDRLLIAQAQKEKLTIMTPDKKFKKYEVQSVW